MDSAVTSNLEPGTVLATRYRIESVLGQGGMGAVYLGRIDALNKPVAIKEMRVQASDDKRQQQAIDQFRQEAHFLANLDHPNLVQVTDFFVEDNRYYLVMAYVKGQNLSEIMNSRRATLPVGQVLDWALQLSSVLSYLHSQEPPILFRDLKPSNIMLDSAGMIRLIDFGIARSFNPDQATVTFLQGVGSAGYAPLEQYQGAGGTDPRSDIYALGATLFHLLTNKVPASPVELVAAGTGPPSAQKLNPSIPPALDKVIAKMMGLRKDERYQSMQQVRNLLEQIAQSLQQSDDCTENLAPLPAPVAATLAQPRLQPVGQPVASQGLGSADDSGGAALWVTAGGLCLAALSLFVWLFLQAQPGAQVSPSPTPPLAEVSVSQLETSASPGPAPKPLKPPPKPLKPVKPVEVGQRPRPVSRPRPAPKPTGVVQKVPTLPGGDYPTAPSRPKPLPNPVASQAPAQLPPAPAPEPQPTSASSSHLPPGIVSGQKGWWGNHPGYPTPRHESWVQDNKNSWHPPPGAPPPPSFEETSKEGGDRVK
jgi:serine/threonine-protein kinase